jgi:hypothetical protein
MQLLKDTIYEFVRTLGGMAAAILVLSFLAKTFLTQRLSTELEAYKAELKATADAALERLKAELSTALRDREIRLSALHAQVIDAVSGAYARLYRLQAAIEDYVRPFEAVGEGPRSERAKRLADALADLRDFFETRALYFPPDVYEMIFGFHMKINERAVEFQLFVDQRIDPAQWTERWKQVTEFTSEESPKLLRVLRERFQTLVEITDQAS